MHSEALSTEPPTPPDPVVTADTGPYSTADDPQTAIARLEATNAELVRRLSVLETERRSSVNDLIQQHASTAESSQLHENPWSFTVPPLPPRPEPQFPSPAILPLQCHRRYSNLVPSITYRAYFSGQADVDPFLSDPRVIRIGTFPTVSSTIVGLTDPHGEQLKGRQLGIYIPRGIGLRKRTNQIRGVEGNEWEADQTVSGRWNRRVRVTLPIAFSPQEQPGEATTADTTDDATTTDLEWRPTPAYLSSQLVVHAWQEYYQRCYILIPTAPSTLSGKIRRPSAAAAKPADLQDIYAVLSGSTIRRYDRDQTIGGKISIVRKGLDKRSMDRIAMCGTVVNARMVAGASHTRSLSFAMGL